MSDGRPDATTGGSWAFETRAVHAGQEPDELTGAVAPPIYQTSTYAQEGVGRPRGGWDYARTANPTRARLEAALVDLEGAGPAGHAIAFASGAAATAMIAELALPGDEIVVGDDVYGGTYRLFERVLRPRGVDARFADLTGGAGALHDALSPRTRFVWFETPSNPLLKLVDIAAVRAAVQGHAGARGERPLVVVDNTFASPALQRPLELGADIVFHSATKYLAGHSDTVNGVVVTRDQAVAERLRFLQNAIGAVPGPFDCFLVLRGLRTLALRMARHTENASVVASFLAGRADVELVRYPGLLEGPHRHPQAPLAARQMAGAGGIVSFLPAARSAAAGGLPARTARERAELVCERVQVFTLAESLGGVESLIEMPAAMTHASTAGSALEMPPALIRLSCGIEAPGDLVADLARALDEA